MNSSDVVIQGHAEISVNYFQQTLKNNDLVF